MAQLPTELKYSKEHEWVRLDGAKATVGITYFAQDQLGDVVFVELPEVGATLTAGTVFGTVESVKTVSDLYAPVTGKIVEVNADLDDQPELVNEEPYGKGWMLVVELSDPAEVDQLFTAEGYEAFINEK